MNKLNIFVIRRWKEFPVNLVTICFLLASAVLNIILVKEIIDLRYKVSYIKAEGQLKIGSQVPTINAKDLAGDSYSIEYSNVGIPTILYIFTPECSWCLRNLQNIKTIASQTSGKYRLIGLSLSSKKVKDYVAQNNLDFLILTDVTSETLKAYKFGGTPQTLIISPEGDVLKNWNGAYMDNLKKEVDEYLQVNLPGLPVENKS